MEELTLSAKSIHSPEMTIDPEFIAEFHEEQKLGQVIDINSRCKSLKFMDKRDKIDLLMNWKIPVSVLMSPVPICSNKQAELKEADASKREYKSSWQQSRDQNPSSSSR